ncbi:hypothetical protein D2V05_05675 [Flagellimonas pelagia]|uniref:Uncharacterized protein n=2 Tax=Flagellimonas pelagia TaxID=2306998 RepID=A0A3A1NJJ5_9FLAO|nr:hypothetical protein D2V05_05675 [Allomuricauda maritima]
MIFTNMDVVRFSCAILSILGFVQGVDCSKKPVIHQDVTTQIRVINHTEHRFTNISLFSMDFGDLNPMDSTAFKDLKYDALKDDPLIYCVFEGKNLGRYINIPEKNTQRFSYSIDSLRNGILYVSSTMDRNNP